MVSRTINSRSDFATGALHRFELHRFEWPLWAVAVACATGGVFWLPWCFPSTTPAVGESYVLGFNNRVAIYCLAVSIASATGARMVSRKPASAIRWLTRCRRVLPPLGKAKAEYGVLIICSAIWANVLWSWGNYIVDPAWGDARVNIYNIDLLAIGRVPYRDFSVIYGFSMIYLPYWLSFLTGGDVSFEGAYHAVLVLFVVVGFVVLFIFLRALRVPAKSRPLILLLVLLSWAIFVTALAHVSLRYANVPAGLVLMHGAIQRFRGRGVAAAMACLLSSAIAVVFSLAVSPDMGLALAFGCAAYAFGLLIQANVRSAACCLAGPVLAIVGILARFPTYFLTVFAFSGGMNNLPVYPNAHNLLLVTSAVIVLPALIASALQNRTDARCPLALGLATAGGIMLVGAFGRAAPFHVACNGLIVLTTMFAAAASRGKRLLVAYMCVFAAVQICLTQVSWWAGNSGTFATAVQMKKIYAANPLVVAAWKEKWDQLRARHPRGKHLHWSSVLPYPEELDAVAARGPIIQTDGGEWNLWLGRYLLLQPDAPREFFHCWTAGPHSADQIERRLDECLAAKFLLVPEHDLAMATQKMNLEAYKQNIDRWLSWAMIFPVMSPVRFAPFFPSAELTAKIVATHKPVGRLQFFIYSPFILMEKHGE